MEAEIQPALPKSRTCDALRLVPEGGRGRRDRASCPQPRFAQVPDRKRPLRFGGVIAAAATAGDGGGGADQLDITIGFFGPIATLARMVTFTQMSSKPASLFVWCPSFGGLSARRAGAGGSTRGIAGL